jgi:hypothetical protein
VGVKIEDSNNSSDGMRKVEIEKKHMISINAHGSKGLRSDKTHLEYHYSTV